MQTSFRAALELIFLFGLRVGILGGRFVMNIAIVEIYGADRFGVFVIFISVMYILEVFTALELQQVCKRDYLEVERDKRPLVIRDQALIQWAVLAATGAVLLLLGPKLREEIGLFPSMGMVMTLLVLSVASNELFRFVALEHGAGASMFSSFIRTSSWAYVLALMSLMGWRAANFDFVLLLWLGSMLVSMAISVWYLRGIGWSRMIREPIDFGSMRNMIVRSMPFLLSAVCLLFFVYTDRYILKMFSDFTQVGIYVFYSNFARSLDQTLSSIVPIFFFPRLFNPLTKGDADAFKDARRRFMKTIYLLIAIGVFVIVVATYFYVHTPRSAAGLRENLPVFAVSMLGGTLLALGQVPQMDLFLARRDFLLLSTLVAAYATTVVFLFLLVPHQGMMGAAWATLIGNFQLLLSRTYLARLARRSSDEVLVEAAG